MLNQIFDAINIGLVIMDRDLVVLRWNRWMAVHSGVSAEKIVGTSLLDTFPDLDDAKFRRSVKSVLSFGNFCFFSQKLHHYLFPFKSTSYFGKDFEYMQQSCAMGPLRDENNEIQYIFLYVHDMTEVAVYEQKLVEMNMRDALTGFYNRRYMEIKLTEEFSRAKRYGRDFSLIIFDLDFFKKVNDEHGHQCGDFVLRSVCFRISSNMRNVDLLFRYGGEEFCCILPETGLESAMLVAERFRKAIMEMENNYNDSIVKVTISLGVSALTENIDSSDLLFNKADEALYKAKREGRNRVEAMER
jgi:diguanylate cyclase (GGDEF)-like protein/PAS domain S-box-containing protein